MNSDKITESKAAAPDPADETKKEPENYMVIGMCLGLCLGTAFGSIFDNLAMGISIGLCIGLAIGLSIKKKKA